MWDSDWLRVSRSVDGRRFLFLEPLYINPLVINPLVINPLVINPLRPKGLGQIANQALQRQLHFLVPVQQQVQAFQIDTRQRQLCRRQAVMQLLQAQGIERAVIGVATVVPLRRRNARQSQCRERPARPGEYRLPPTPTA